MFFNRVDVLILLTYSILLFVDITIQTPFFQNFSYLAFRKTDIRTSTHINITFKPLALNGILFYVSYDDQTTTGDFLSIILHNG